ncbi:hypothetical protein [Vibrio metschnikovii]|uniref:hypothetical protein n=2 Tax=Vibrio TaxID=662 RepID=UPI003320B5EE
MPVLVLSGMVVIYSSLPLYISALLVLASIASLSYVAWNYESYIQTVKQQKKQIEHLSALQESQLESYHSLEPLFIESLPVWARHIDSANQHLTDSVFRVESAIFSTGRATQSYLVSHRSEQSR